ncbi:hypothetical protein IFR05_016952 [Cadophora sp. M221]|nr:hypothetical protein IFR05_016952 [Cadophora sp. M221]
MNQDLCRPCQRLFRQEYPPAGQPRHESRQHHTTVWALKESASFCQICLLVWTQLSPVEQDHWHATDFATADPSPEIDGVERGVYCSSSSSNQRGPYNLQFRSAKVGGATLIGPLAVLYLKVIRDKEDITRWREEYKDQQSNNLASGSTDSAKTLALVRSWLDRCVESHECHKGQFALPWSPSRLIEVKKVDGLLRAKLCDGYLTPGWNRTVKYATLSHCWGTTMHTCLTSSNLYGFQSGIPIDQLSTTFLDAMNICLELDLPYIWIDSLCIIQDSKEDWEKECANMEKVYAQGYVNLAATHAKDGTGGCFTQRDPKLLRDSVVWNKPPGENAKRRWLRITSPFDNWTMNVLHAPLNRRAWVLQERILSPRKIHFGKHMVYWECLSHVASEVSPAGLAISPLGTFKFSSDSQSRKEQEDALWAWWKEVADTYTGTSITYSKDRAVAFSGIAKHLQFLFDKFYNRKTDYVAGLWSHWPEQQLAWETRGTNDEVTVDQVARRIQSQIGLEEAGKLHAPSWSWTSVDASIRIPRCTEENQSFILFRVRNTLFDLDEEEESEFLSPIEFSLPVAGWLWKREAILDNHKVFVNEYGFPDPGVQDIFTDTSQHYLLPLRWHLPDRDNSVYRLRCMVLVPASDEYRSRAHILTREQHNSYFRRVGCMWYELYADRLLDPETREEPNSHREFMEVLISAAEDGMLFKPLGDEEDIPLHAEAENDVIPILKRIYRITIV